MLCVGAQVMMLKNSPAQGLVNGSRGVVVGFEDESTAIGREALYGRLTEAAAKKMRAGCRAGSVVPLVEFANGRRVAILRQV